MRLFALAADVAMGIILGAFLFAALIRIWPALRHPVTAGFVGLASILIVLFRRPNGSLAPRQDR